MQNSVLANNKLPFGNIKIVLSILGMISSFMLVGFIFGVISVYLANKDHNMAKSFPQNYTESALRNHKIGFVLSWLSFIVSTIGLFSLIYLFYTYGTIDKAMIDMIKNS